MPNSHHEVTTARKSKIKELVEHGVSRHQDLVKSIQGLPEFASLCVTSLSPRVTQYCRELGIKFEKRGGKNTSKALRDDRKLSIQQLLKAGVTDRGTMVQHLQRNTAFAGLSIDSIVKYIRKHELANTTSGASNDAVTARTAAVKTLTVPPETQTSSLDAVLQSTQFRASVRSLRLAEYDRMVSLLRPLWQKFETELQALRKVKQGLDVRVNELENHYCPDPDEKLREENAKLKDKISFLERRVDALSQLTKPRLNESHFAISAHGR